MIPAFLHPKFSHLKTCHIQSALALRRFSITLSVFLTEVLLEYLGLSDSLSYHAALSFQWVLGMLVFLLINWQVRSPKPEQPFSFPCPLAPVIAKT